MADALQLAYRYRLYPTKAQETALAGTLETCRQVYDSLLNWRKHDYEALGRSPSKARHQAAFPKWKAKTLPDGKQEHAELGAVYSQVLQNVAARVDLAFAAFFRRVKDGETPGHPRIKGHGQYDSITYPQSGFGVVQSGFGVVQSGFGVVQSGFGVVQSGFGVVRGRLRLSKIGDIALRLHRPIEGTIKACTVRRINGKWFVCLAVEAEPGLLPPSSEEVGIDVGLKTFASLSNGESVENPRFFRRDEKALAKAQRKLARQKRRGRERRNKNYDKAKKVVSRIHERIRNRRHDFCHQTARRLVNRFGVIAVEKLNVKGMVRNHCLAKSIADASWSMFRSVLTGKAERANRLVVAVNPAYTSQRCSGCGDIQKKPLSVRTHRCSVCGLFLDRDTNAAVNIRAAVGQHSLAALAA